MFISKEIGERSFPMTPSFIIKNIKQSSQYFQKYEYNYELVLTSKNYLYYNNILKLDTI